MPENQTQATSTNEVNDFEGVELAAVQPPAVQEAAPAQKTPEENVFDEETYVKGLGFESVESAKTAYAELLELRKLKDQPAPEFKAANEETQKFLDYVKEGKTPELTEFLIKRDRLERMSNADASKLEQAADIIKLNMRLKNEDLTPDEVDFQFSEDFQIPEKPEQDEDEDDSVFQKREDRWKKEVERVEKRMIIAAKQAKPELAKLKSELVIPDIQRVDAKAQAAAQKELDDAKAESEQFLKMLNSDFKNFNGYNATLKDEEVEIGIGYNIPDEEKAAVKTQLESFATEGYAKYFGERWFDQAGAPKIDQIMSDIYLLNNRDKVFQKLVNDSASKRLEHQIKQRSNIQVNENVPRGTFQPDEALARKQKEEEFLMDA